MINLRTKDNVMIADFTISNFASIRNEQRFSFVPNGDTLMADEYFHKVAPGVNLLKLGIIYGANASGKSNILKAFDFYRNLMVTVPDSKSQALDYMPFLFDEKSRDKPSAMSMTIYISGKRYILSVEFDRTRIYSESLTVYNTTRRTILYKRTYNINTDSADVEFSTAIKLIKSEQRIIVGNTINNCTVMAAFGKSNVSASQLNDIYNFFTQSFKITLSPDIHLEDISRKALQSSLDGTLKRFMLYFLKASDYNISDLSFRDGAHFSFLHQTDKGTYEMDETFESRGTMRFLGLATLLYNLIYSDSFVSIDEVENSIHYELVAYFLKCFLANSEGESQLLVTTHDINLLNENFIRRDVIWFADKDKDGVTGIERLSALGIHKNISPYNAYRQGKLVKLPFLDSVFFNLSVLPQQ